MIEKVLKAYEINADAVATPFGHGLINSTWKIDDEKDSFILQKINTAIFKDPQLIADNIKAVADYLAIHHPGYFFCTPCKATDGKDLVYLKEEGYFRMYPFIKNSYTIDVVENTNQTFEAAKKFGELTKLLSAFPVHQLKITLPDFHNISLRYKDFLTAITEGDKERINKSATLIEFLKAQQNIVSDFEKIKASNAFKLRVTHHDTKINNVLFDDKGKGVCVIDLDTLMPGYFISDAGDMIRTYISPVGEEEKDFSKIAMREDYFTAVAEGYLNEMYNELNETELNHFVFAGKFMIYMQALRFLTDYLYNDIYYGSVYEGQNFIRAGNQAQLLKLLIENEEKFQSVVAGIAAKNHAA